MWNAAKKLALTPVDPWFEKMADGLAKTRQHLVGQVADMLRLHKKIDDDLWDDLEGVLLTSDVGVAATDRIMEELRSAVKAKRLSEPSDLLGELRAIVSRIIEGDGENSLPRTMNIEKGRVNVILLVGVNGAGKTTTAGKLAAYYKGQGMKVMLAAADTFRAAAIDQLQVWADRVGIDMIRHQEGSDPAAVVYDAISAAKARGVDVLIADTAGRLHNKANLMEELRKIRRVAGRDLEGAPHEVILVLDAAAGQNALEQAKVFNEVTELTGLVLCKLDGTGRGGIIAAISQELHIPVKFIGVGEGIDDMREFVPSQFLDALFEGKADKEKEEAGGQ
ncbi:MAG: signal recognition particle-docking protein FtsY [bacterium]|nr:signal recognition particle-docking protein FtsY [bacterium]